MTSDHSERAPALQPSVAWVEDHIEIIDQTALPTELNIRSLTTVDEVVEAIVTLAVRGAPAIGACGGLGVVVGLDQSSASNVQEATTVLGAVAERIGSARPTAVNLAWAVERVRSAASGSRTVDEVRRRALDEALAIIEEDRVACSVIGEVGRQLLSGAESILTHCNTGRLATAGWGTALGIVYAKAAAGEPVKVFACETRPLGQGARLTAWELCDADIDVTLIPDSAAALALHSGRVDAVIVGADRIVANGDTANKIGTLSHAVNSQRAGVPFYVAAPASTFDLSLESGAEIEIEQRSGDELRTFNGVAVAPESVPVWNPAFDVTPGSLITAFITEHGVVHPPFRDSIRERFGDKPNPGGSR